MRLACDTGGTFTDLIVEDEGGRLDMFKASTTPADPVEGVINALKLAAEDAGVSLAEYLSRADTFIHGTTHAINAVITGRTARTALLTTEGHPDVLVLREGGRAEPFNRSEEHTSELQSLLRISYAVFCLKKKRYKNTVHT